MNINDLLDLFPNAPIEKDRPGPTRKGAVHIVNPAARPSRGKISLAEYRRRSKAMHRGIRAAWLEKLKRSR